MSPAAQLRETQLPNIHAGASAEEDDGREAGRHVPHGREKDAQSDEYQRNDEEENQDSTTKKRA